MKIHTKLLLIISSIILATHSIGCIDYNPVIQDNNPKEKHYLDEPSDILPKLEYSIASNNFNTFRSLSNPELRTKYPDPFSFEELSRNVTAIDAEEGGFNLIWEAPDPSKINRIWEAKLIGKRSKKQRISIYFFQKCYVDVGDIPYKCTKAKALSIKFY